MTLIKSISGIRGTIGGEVGQNLTPLDIVKFTAAYAKLMKEQAKASKLKIVVGRDARISGEMVDKLITGTLLGCGVDVIEVGLCTTPGVEMAVISKKADGGIIITASHNPKQWNALKLLNNKGEFLNDTFGKKVLEYAEKESFEFVEVDNLGKIIESQSFDNEHINAVLSLPLVDVELVKSKDFTVVVDAVNSVGGTVIPALLQRMGVNVIELNCEPNGIFAHNPEPLKENLTEISEKVIETKADFGIVVDPDVDRLAFICEDGEMFGEEYTLVAVADYVLSNTQGNTVSNLSSTRALRDITLKHKGEYSASAVGEVNVVEMMKQTGAVIGGEGNGGIIYPELHYGRDALVGVALFLTHLAQKNKTISELKKEYPTYFISKNKIELSDSKLIDKVLLEIKEAYCSENVNDIDGIKIDFADSWVHLRRSNTEPIIRIYSESKDEQSAEELANKIIEKIKKILNSTCKCN
ncbi:MAG: phosphoglucosamine mutase [Rikenellaceae bacterium]